jgi:tRNA pseudouridine38-40 synthase
VVQTHCQAGEIDFSVPEYILVLVLSSLRNIKLTIEYDGTNFAGWQRQATQWTVQGELEKGLKRLTAEKVTLIAAGRTDSGTHALGQVANFKTHSKMPVKIFPKALKFLLSKGILVRNADEVPLEFNSRNDAKAKVYRYRILLEESVLMNNQVWQYTFPVNPNFIRKATRAIMGKHDFSSFCVAKSRKESNICRMSVASWKKSEKMLEFEIEGDRFLHSMVRILVGTLMEVGRGLITPQEFKKILQAKDRRRAGRTAPACGLYLVEVKF